MPAVVGTLLGWLAGGSALAALVSVVGIISGLVFGLVYRRYLGILGANRRVAAERQTYDALRESLAGSNLATRLYARWLTAFLDRVDRFFGDAGQADQTLFPHAFGLRTPAPLWTAPAFDRCLLLALLYPIASIFIIWAIYGQVGPAEAALRLKAGLSFWQRGNVAIVVGFSFFLPFLFRPPTSPMKPLGWKGLKTRRSIALISLLGIVTVVQVFGRPDLGVFAGASSIAVIGALTVSHVRAGVGAGAFTIVFAFAFLIGGGFLGFLSVAGIIAAAFLQLVSLIGLVAGDSVVATVFAFLFAGVLAYAVVLYVPYAVARLSSASFRYRWQGVFFSLFLSAMILVCLAAAHLLSPLGRWEEAGPMLLFLGLLTLLNAPFDWASLGLTRALLHRGLELGGWWPYALALVDAGLAALIIAALALTMVVGVQGFDALAVHSGGTSVLPLDALFKRHRRASVCARILVALRASAFDHDPKPRQPRDWRDIAGARVARLAGAAPALHPGAHRCSQMGPALDRHCPDRPGRGGRRLRHRSPGLPGLGHHRLRHAVFRPGAVRHVPRRGRLQPAATGGAALRGLLVADAGSANLLGHSLDRRRVGSLGLAIMIRSDVAERERRRGDPPTRRRSFPRFSAADCARGRSLRTTAPLERRSLALSPPPD